MIFTPPPPSPPVTVQVLKLFSNTQFISPTCYMYFVMHCITMRIAFIVMSRWLTLCKLLCNCYNYINSGRRCGLVVSALDSGSRGPGSSPGRVIVLCSWARHFTLTVPLSTQEYKWVPANCPGNLTNCWEATCDGLASHPSAGVAIFLVASWYRNRDKLRQSWATRLVRLNPTYIKIISMKF